MECYAIIFPIYSTHSICKTNNLASKLAGAPTEQLTVGDY